MKLKDGLYVVDQLGIYAAFVVHEGKVTNCAPILRSKLDYWKTKAKWVPTDSSIPPVTLEPAEKED